MKKVLAITLMLLLVSSAAMATDTNWRIGLKPDNGAGMGSGGTSHLGEYPTSLDGLDSQDTLANYGTDISQTTIWGVGLLGDGNTYARDIKAGDLVVPKAWDLRVAALPLSAYTQIRLQFVQISPAVNPPATVTGYGSVWYELEMIDNKNVVGAPANGTIWDVTSITGGSATVPTLLPIKKLSAPTHGAMIAEGYQLEFRQMVPEPSSMLALGTGLVGLVGFVCRRRRA